MGYEIQYTYHPRKESGSGYNEEITEEKQSKVGKPFDDTPLEKCAAAIMAQLARRDVLVVDVQVNELVRKEISFKETKDGKGIVLKNKRFSLNQTAEMVTEDEFEEAPPQAASLAPNPPPVAPNPPPVAPNPATAIKHPHEMIQVQQQNDVESLYSSSAASMSGINPRTVNQNKRLYQVIFDPAIPFVPQIQKMKLKLTEGKRYNVHASQKANIAITDDSGQVLVIDEKFFSAAGAGLFGDAELGFSESSSGPADRRPKLAFEDDMHMHHPADQQAAAIAASQNGGSYKKVNENIRGDIPLDDGTVPDSILEVPDLRPGLKV